MPEISAELLGGPWSGNTGRLTFHDRPPLILSFQLDSEAGAGLILPSQSTVSDKLTAIYVQVQEKPRKVLTYDDAGRARSELGVRYRYDRKLSPCQVLFEQADADAHVEAAARETVEATRKLLLADAWEQARKSRRDVERVGDLTSAHAGRLVSVDGGAPRRYTGQRRDFTRDGGVAVTLDGVDVALLVDTPVLLLDAREA